MQQVLLEKKGTRVFSFSISFSRWKNSSTLILVVLISNQHFKSKLSYVKLNVEAKLFAIVRYFS